jgi:hypothetical protein
MASRALAVVVLALAVVLAACSSPYRSAEDPSGATDDEATIDGGGGGPAPQGLDAGGACKTSPSSTCGAPSQCGCGNGQTCDVQDEHTGAASCVAAGAATLGGVCSATTDCAQGLTCLYGACRPYCAQARTYCTTKGTQLCVEVKAADHTVVPGMNVCTIACDPRLPQAFCGTNSCVWFASYYAPVKRVSDCGPAGTGGANAPCTKPSDCQPAFACNAHPTRGQECEAWCRLGANDCPAGQTCVDVFGSDAPVIDTVHEGLCQL